ncbi:SPOR domain-containing protein [Gynuella sp.]|uniref:SPOR domain-containing protein n=1 Tax=Gynuella sp. TaxID=2969146 RepID=UPI003D14F6E6
MFAKLGLVILIVLFGASLFVAGTMAPENIADPVRETGKKIVNWLGGQDTEQTDNPHQGDSTIITYSSLIPAAGSSENQSYGIQIGLYATQKEADTAALQLTANNYDFKEIQVRDKLDIERYLLIAGPFPTLSLVQFQQQRLPQILGLSAPLNILLFPQ